jgi:MSHA biogenesis protein MshJ
MKDKVQLIENKINALELRERIIICVTVIFLVMALFDQLWFSPNLENISALKKEHKEFIRTGQDFQNTLVILEGEIARDPNQAIRKEITSAEKEAKKLDKILTLSSAGLISPERMLPVLGEVLGKKSGLRLIEMSNTAPERVNSNQDVRQVDFFKHGLELHFSGSFKNVREYVRRLENMSEKVYLDEVSFQLLDYPNGEFVLKAHTLSVYEALISG